MTYGRPEVQKLGDAADVIRILNCKGCGVNLEFITGERDFNPAYDLDE